MDLFVSVLCRNRSLPVVILILLFIAAPASLAQKKSIPQYVHDHYTTANGLPQNSATDIIQTQDGYLWFATQEGAARFDGVRFTVFDRTNVKGLKSAWITGLFQDSEGGLWIRPLGLGHAITRYKDGAFQTFTVDDGLPSDWVTTNPVEAQGAVWIGTGNGVSRFKDGKFTTFGVKDGLLSDTVGALSADRRGRLWIGTSHGMSTMKDGAVMSLSRKDGFLDSTVSRINTTQSVYEDSHGRIWFAAPGHLYAYAEGALTPYTIKDGDGELAINAIHEDRKGNLWFGTAKGLRRFDNGRFITYEASKDLDENTITEIREDPAGDLWLATNRGIKRFSNGTFETYRRREGLSSDVVICLYIDKEGSIWVGTDGGGVERFRDGKFITYSMQNGLSYDLITPVLQDSHGALWVGTAAAGVNRFDLATGSNRVFDEHSGLPSDFVQTLYEDSRGAMWVGTARGAARIEGGRITDFNKANGFKTDLVGAFVERKNGDFLASVQNAVWRWEHGAFKPYHALDGIRTPIGWMMEDSKGTLWIGTRNGVYRQMNDSLHHYTAAEGLRGYFALWFYEDRDGVIWLSMGNEGLFRYKNNQFAEITPKQGLFDYSAYTLLEDGKGYVWMSSNKGVYRVQKKELDDVADGKAQSVRSIAYGEADGMASRECDGGYTPSAWKLQDGRMCFSTVKGIAMVDPARITLNKIPPPVALEGFSVDGKPQDLRSTAKLPAGSSKFEFHFAGLSYVGADKVRFKYMLEGFDKAWVDAGTRRDAYYTNLPPGDYSFHVIAANSDGFWSADRAMVGFHLAPFFYQSSWFLALGIFLFLTTGPSIYFLRMRSLKRRAAVLEAQVDHRTQELQKTLDHLKETQNQLVLSEKMASLGQLTAGIAHEIKNPLNFITNFAVLSQDLTKELREELILEREHVDPKRAAAIKELLDDLEQNVEKINDHGKRADSIVRGMLLHSRGKAGERQETDLNALLGEYTNLAYHGMRAQDQSFNIKIETDFDPSVGRVNIVPQDLSRAFLNIVNNACYAANDKRRALQNGFMPVVRVATRNLGDRVEIRIRDNGAGIPEAIREKIFNPFFTTKPAGVGTGLGLSLTYDTITQEHKGTIALDTQVGEYTEFIITLPNGHDGRGVES